MGEAQMGPKRNQSQTWLGASSAKASSKPVPMSRITVKNMPLTNNYGTLAR